jgi:hypothetical protein
VVPEGVLVVHYDSPEDIVPRLDPSRCSPGAVTAPFGSETRTFHLNRRAAAVMLNSFGVHRVSFDDFLLAERLVPTS